MPPLVSASERRSRQLEELLELCRRGAIARAIDLAFEHVACFGHDDELVVLLAGVVDRQPSDELRGRLEELRATSS